jgi:hypothetical protein
VVRETRVLLGLCLVPVTPVLRPCSFHDNLSFLKTLSASEM